MLGFGVLDVGFWVLGFRFGFWVRGSEIWVLVVDVGGLGFGF